MLKLKLRPGFLPGVVPAPDCNDNPEVDPDVEEVFRDRGGAGEEREVTSESLGTVVDDALEEFALSTGRRGGGVAITAG
jgi:hypothetical protein